ncbi:MAG: hypothetical protein WC982_14250 [Advenella sp.]
MKQSEINAFNILNNVKVTNLDSVLETINANFNKGLIDELTAEQAFGQIEILEKAMGHKYFKREGSPGNYKYYYTEAEYNKAKGKKSEENKENRPTETIEKDGKRYKLQPNGKYLEVSEQGMTKKDSEKELERIRFNDSEGHSSMSEQAGMGKLHANIRKLSDKEFTKEELTKESHKKESSSFNWDSGDAKILARFGITKDNLVVKDNLDLFGSPITSLPENLKVGGNLDLYGSSITSLPKGLEVGGHLSLSETPITSLPEGLKVGGNLYLSKTSITSLTRDDFMEIGGKIFINK